MARVTDMKSIERYADWVMDIRAALENLTEFFSTLPAPDDDENHGMVVNGISYTQLEMLGRMHQITAELSEIADEISDGMDAGKVEAVARRVYLEAIGGDGGYGDLTDYDTNEVIRPATAEERGASIEAAMHGGGAGVIDVDGRRCYVAD